MTPLARRIEELRGCQVRLRIADGRAVTSVDGQCLGIEGNNVILTPSSAGELTRVRLERVYVVTQIPGDVKHQGGRTSN